MFQKKLSSDLEYFQALEYLEYLFDRHSRKLKLRKEIKDVSGLLEEYESKYYGIDNEKKCYEE